jgi:protein-S-isoprenylcysteine O-methyltransferase Ste14
MGAFITAAIVIVLLMFFTASLIASAQERVIKAIRAHIMDVKRWGGYLLVFVGIWFLILAVFADFFAQIFPV